MPSNLRAEPGAPAAPGGIPLSVPEIRGNEWTYIKDCLDTGWVSSVGAYVDRFERELAGRAGTAHAVATASGTAALHVALLLAGIQPDDEVLVSTLTFIAPVNAIRYVGARPVFIDAEPAFWEMDAQKLADFLSGQCVWQDGGWRNRTSGRRVRAIVPVDILGHPCDMDAIRAVADRYGLALIEDASESLGAEYKGKPAGSTADVSCFSFNGNKLITTGGGGMIATNNEAWARRAKYLTTQAKDDPIEFVHGEVGFNYRLTNIQAALGCAQLEQLDSYLERKRAIAERYDAAFDGLGGLTPPQEAPWARSSRWLYTVLVDEQRFGMSSRALLKHLGSLGIQTRPLWQPIHLSPAHAGAQAFRCDTAERLYRDALSLPCSVGLSEVDQERVIAAIAKQPVRAA